VVEPVAEVVREPEPLPVVEEARPQNAAAAAPATAPELPLTAPEAPPARVEVEERAEASGLAALAAAAGGQARVEVPPATPPEAAQPQPSETSRRFLDPLGSVTLDARPQPAEAPQPGQRFRSSVLSEDKMRPAWERKYVD
jgi:hypothetical protein